MENLYNKCFKICLMLITMYLWFRIKFLEEHHTFELRKHCILNSVTVNMVCSLFDESIDVWGNGDCAN